MKKLILMVTIITFVLACSTAVFAENAPDGSQTIQNAISSDASADLSGAATDNKADKVKKSDAKVFKEKLTPLMDQLNTLRAECDNLWTQIKAVNESIKSQWSSRREELKSMEDKEAAKQIMTDLKSRVEPLHAQVKAIHADIQSLRDQKSTEWDNFKAAVKERDEVKATAALTNIISLKGQIIDKQKELLPLKQQILDAISG